MESTTELPELADTAAPHSSTSSDTRSAQADSILPRAPTASPIMARRKASTKKLPPFSMKRAASTPNVRTVAGAEALAVSVAEKKRNKLGYHRTSVACGHCRRRKIRCLIAPEDPQGKCQNCIRLKKDCNFFPVEQQVDLDEHPRPDSKLDTLSNEAGASDSSSPSLTGSRVSEHLDDPSQRLQHFPSSGIHQDVQAVGSLSRSLTNPPSTGRSSGLLQARQSTDGGAGHLSARTHETFPTYEQNVPWASSFIQQSPQSSATDRASAEEQPYWRYGPSMPTSYPQHPYSTMHSSPLAHSPHSRMELIPNMGHRDFRSWSVSAHPPPRSMSLVGPDELSVHYQNHYYHNTSSDFHPSTNMPEIQPFTLPSNNSAMPRPDHPLLLPGEGFFHDSPAPNVNYVFPSDWSPIPNQSPQIPDIRPEGFTHQWYQEPSALAQVKEEETGSQLHHSTHPDNLAYQANPG